MGLNALLGSLMSGGPALGIAVLAGAGLFALKGGRPVAKKAITGYLALSEWAREFAAETSEQVQDLYAEAKTEYDDRRGDA
ncbi:MAG: hypothetical protein HW416_1042 [Chloroflexi bacterium]|nr:hypothetical protein [Chloroflexota bacterium]